MEHQGTRSHAELEHKPAWDMEDLCFHLGLPQSTLLEVMAKHPAPMFLLGRRKYILREKAVEWLEDVAYANPFTPRRNNRRA